MADNSQAPGATWLVFALMTVVSWGVSGVFLHTGQTQMGGGDPASARYKAFLAGLPQEVPRWSTPGHAPEASRLF